MSINRSQTQKHLDFTQEEISDYLKKIKHHVINNKYTISKNEKRKENIEFIEDYKINTEKEKDILLSINCKDFCYAVDNEKEAYSHETLYVFCKQRELDFWGNLELVDIYIKINMTQTSKGSFMYIISFHERNKPIEYLFRDIMLGN
ncbi:MAG: hypothetical protein ACOCRO_01390 [Halanaerobiales bacterium]